MRFTRRIRERSKSLTVLKPESGAKDHHQQQQQLQQLQQPPQQGPGLETGLGLDLSPAEGGGGSSAPAHLEEPTKPLRQRTYSSSAIKARNVEVGSGDFDKVRLIGRGDVGKVYLVREKKTQQLFAMKSECLVVKV